MFLFVLGIIATIVLFFVLGIEFTDDAVEMHFRKRQFLAVFGLILCGFGPNRTDWIYRNFNYIRTSRIADIRCRYSFCRALAKGCKNG